MKIKILFLIGLCLWLSGIKAEEPGAIIEQTTTKVLQVLKQFPGPENKAARRKNIREILQNRFDYDQMSKLALAQHWRTINKKEKEEFSALFQKLLEQTYIEKMELYTDEKITMGKAVEMGKNKVSVETFIQTGGGEIPIHYKMYQKNSEWMIYDVNIEGVGLIQNYRSQFKEYLYKNSFSDLLKKLEEMIND